MNVFIFGGSGFIGSHLIEYHQKKFIGCDVINCDISDPKNTNYSCYFNIDIRIEISISFKINKTDNVIYNLAAIHKTPGHEDYEYFETNIFGAENVCNFAREHDINTIVFTSSIAPYGASEDFKTEKSLSTPNTPYGISKLVAEEIHKRWQAEDPSNRKLIILRPGVVFGKNEGGNFTRLYQSLKKGIFFYPGRSDTHKACIYVKDLVRIMYEMAEKEPPGFYLYNMCYPEPHTIKEIVNTICEVTGASHPKGNIPPFLLRTGASILKGVSSITGKNIFGIHPDRVTKLMVSTNISGSKLVRDGYHLNYSLKDAISNWYNDCNYEGLF